MPPKDAEAGLMQIMITITQNNRNAEMLASVRRGPFAKPLPQEKIEYLLSRLPKTEARKEFETHALEHVMSFQRRVVACKRGSLARQKKAPLGIVEDYWDRFSGSNC